MSEPALALERSQETYTRSLLAVYDWLVLRLSNRVSWRCPWRRILEHYDRFVSSNHLDVGVGTGFFLDRCCFPREGPRLALMDTNPNSLEVASRRLARYRPELYRANVLEPIELQAPRFDSLGMSYLLHCLPGTLRSKAVVFEHLGPLLTRGAVVFGATLLHRGVTHTWLSKKQMAVLNERGVFCNRGDSLLGLKAALARHLSESAVEVVGCAALFSGRI